MERVQTKLHSSSGASLVIALLFLLLCLTVGAVILTAAASNAGRMSHARANQQAYLTVSSAAELVREELEGLIFTAVEEERYYSESGNTVTDAPVFSISDAHALPGLVNQAAQAVYSGSSFSKTLSVTDAASEFDPVSATFSMDGNYDVSVSFSLPASSEVYPLTLALPGEVSDVTSSSVSYYDVIVTEDVEGVPTDVTYTYSITTTTRTVTVTWNDGVIAKGG
jgi:hypothetical protein